MDELGVYAVGEGVEVARLGVRFLGCRRLQQGRQDGQDLKRGARAVSQILQPRSIGSLSQSEGDWHLLEKRLSLIGGRLV